MKNLIDLHTHTYVSDAEIHLSPEKLVKLAYSNNIKAIAITDHDSIVNIDRAIKAGKKYSIEVVPGIELSTFEDKLELHILGYYISYKDQEFLNALKKQILGRNKRAKIIIEKFNAAGANINFSKIKNKINGDYVAQYHIALELVKQGFVDSIFEALKEMAKGGIAHVPYYEVKEYLFDLNSGIKFLRKYNGITILAHPGSLKLNKKVEKDLIKNMVYEGLQGLEVFSRKHTSEQTEYYKNLAHKYNLLITGGTDFHGLNKKMLVGTWDGNLKVPYTLLEKLKSIHKSVY